MKKLRWGILGVARIAVTKVIPAMQQGELTEVAAIASRDLAKAQDAGRKLGIPRAYGSYEELLADREIDARVDARGALARVERICGRKGIVRV